MSEYWKSNAKKYCEVCKCWFADNKVSIEDHEKTLRHKSMVQKRLREVTQNEIQHERQYDKLSSTLIQMEQTGLKSMGKSGNTSDISKMKIDGATGPSIGAAAYADTGTVVQKVEKLSEYERQKQKVQAEREKLRQLKRTIKKSTTWENDEASSSQSSNYSELPPPPNFDNMRKKTEKDNQIEPIPLKKIKPEKDFKVETEEDDIEDQTDISKPDIISNAEPIIKKEKVIQKMYNFVFFIVGIKDEKLDEYQLSFSLETLVKSVKERLQKRCLLDVENQKITYNKIILKDHWTLSSFVKEDNDEFYVAHNGLSKYNTILDNFEKLTSGNVVHKKKRLAEIIQTSLYKIEKDGFFKFYDNYALKSDEIYATVDKYICGIDEILERAVVKYFKNLYNNCDVTFKKNEKAGIQKGVICTVNDDIYYVKKHGNMGRDVNHCSPDIREVLAYRILYAIGVAPEVHIIYNHLSGTYESKFALFIATKAIPGFIEKFHAVGFDKEYELRLIKHIFFLTDLHSKNYGVDADGSLWIVDFMIEGCCKHSKSSLTECLRKNEKERLKNLFNKWNIIYHLQNAVEIVKKEQEAHQNLAWNGDLQEYVKLITENFNYVNHQLN